MPLLPISVEKLKNKLVAEGIITAEMFDILKADSERKNQDFLDTLVSENVITNDYLNDYIAVTLGVKRADLQEKGVDDQAVRLLPEDMSRQRQVIIFKKEENGVLDVAMANPND